MVEISDLIARPPGIDYRQFADPFQGYMQGRDMRSQMAAQDALKQGVPRNPDGSRNYGALADQIAKSGNLGAFKSAVDLANAEADRSLERTYKLGTLDIARKKAAGEGIQPGWQQLPDGQMAPIKGGPADPDYIRASNEAKEKPRPFSAGDITKLTEEGGKYQNITNFGQTFQDRFAGYANRSVGNVATAAGRYLPEGMVGKDIADGAGWWQQYDRQKNIIRNELFGSALTVNEQAAFERADINPGMTPAQIRANLAEQQKITAAGMKRKAAALVANGYDPAPVAAAYGIPLSELGVNPQRRAPGPSPAQARGVPTAQGGQPRPGAAPAGPVRVSSPQDHAALPPGTQYIAPDGSLRVKQ